MYTKTDCPFCVKAKKMLVRHQEDFNIIDITQTPTVWEELKAAYGWKTVPMILNREGKFFVLVGGFTDLKEYLEPSE